MSTAVKNQADPAAAADPQKGAAAPDASAGAGDPDAGKNDFIPRSEFEKVLKELHQHKASARTATEQLEQRKIEDMKKNQQYEALANEYKEKLERAEAEKKRIIESDIQSRKYNAVKDSAVRAGIRKEALSDLDLVAMDNVVVETTSTGKINILGADRFVESLKAAKPHWFSSPQAPSVNTDGVRVDGGAGPITPQMILAAETEGRKTGDMSKYRELSKKFQQQSRRH